MRTLTRAAAVMCTLILLVQWSSLTVSAQDKPAPEKPEAPKQETPPETPKAFQVTVTGDIDPESADVIGRLTTLYYQSYPKLVARFSNPKRPAPAHIKLVFKQELRVPAYCTGSDITINLDWLRKNPDDIGLLTHELTHAVQAYPRGVPGWFTEGMADYTRKLYGPEKQPGWELPARITERNKYTDSYRVTGRFLLWLDEKHPGVVDKLHRKAQDREFDIADFKEFTGETIDELWTKCVAELSPKKP